MKANCNRIAKLGFYTGRDNIPEAVKGKKILKDPEDKEVAYTFPP